MRGRVDDHVALLHIIRTIMYRRRGVYTGRPNSRGWNESNAFAARASFRDLIRLARLVLLRHAHSN